MLVEPPRPGLPAGTGLTLPVTATIRLAAGAAALVLAVLSRGDVLVLAALLALLAWRPLAVAALVPALVAGGWRWGSTSLEAISGAQAVLGPAGTVGPTAAAVSAWLAAVAVVLVTPDLRARGDDGWWGRAPGARPRWVPSFASVPRAAQLLGAAAVGATAAVLAAGPAPGGAVWVRVLLTVVATVAALVVATRRRRTSGTAGRWATSRVLDAAAVIAGIGAVVLAASDAPPWSGTFDPDAAGTGITIGLAAAGLLVTAAAAVAALRVERDRRLGSQG